MIADLESHRREYELLHGPTDLRRQYSTQLPLWRQDVLIKQAASTYVANMPDFLRTFLQNVLLASDTALDEMSSSGIVLSIAILKAKRGPCNYRER